MLSAKGKTREEILETFEGYREADLQWRDGHSFAYVYDAGREAEKIGAEFMGKFTMENGLDPTAFPSFKRMENDILRMAAAHLRGDAAVGTFTSGGTESIILAVKTARDQARALRPEIEKPELVMPETAHAAFHKAAWYLGIKPVIAKVNRETFKADIDAMAELINENTIMLVGSSPSYAHGVIDPIPALGRLARERDIWLHVDACVGGFLLPYWRRLGEEVTDFDFSVPGVSSISMDLHKYGFTPKGASVVLYRNKALRHHQFFACSDWTGYTVVNAAVQSSKSGASLAAAWAVMQHLGDEGYLGLAEQLRDATREVSEGIEAIEGLSIMGKPDFCMLAFRSSDTNVFHIIDEMKERGWLIQPQLQHNGIPENIHLSLHPGVIGWVEPFLADLKSAIATSRTLPSGMLAAALGDQLASLDLASLTPDDFRAFMAMAGASDDKLPERMAAINEVLNILPPAASEQLIINFMSDLFTP